MEGKRNTVRLNTILIVDAEPDNTRIRVLNRLDELVFCRQLGPLPETHDQFGRLLAGLAQRFPIAAVGHRFVTALPRAATVVDQALARRLARPGPLGPRHLLPASHALTVARARLAVPHVVCSDTAYYAGLPAFRTGYPLPASFAERHPLRRNGFHGLVHAYAARRAGELASWPVRRLISCHLGPTSSAVAVLDGRPVDATLGFTPTDPLVGASGGPLDAGALLHLILEEQVPAAELRHLLAARSGLAAVWGRPAGLVELVLAARTGDAPARRAVDTHQHQLATAIAGLTVALAGLDALVFTGPLGHADGWLRADLGRRLAYLGITVDPARNADPAADRVLSAAGERVAVLVVPPRVDLEIAREVRAVLAPSTLAEVRRAAGDPGRRALVYGAVRPFPAPYEDRQAVS
jgi:acetate kinase